MPSSTIESLKMEKTRSVHQLDTPFSSVEWYGVLTLQLILCAVLLTMRPGPKSHKKIKTQSWIFFASAYVPEARTGTSGNA